MKPGRGITREPKDVQQSTYVRCNAACLEPDACYLDTLTVSNL